MSLETLSRNARAVAARTYVRILGANRDYSWLIFEVSLPLLSVAAFIYVYKAIAGEEIIGPILTRVILGGAMVAFWMNVLWGMSSTLYYEKEHGFLELYIIAPISIMSVLMGMALGGMFNASIRAVATIFLGSIIFGISFNPSSSFYFALVFIITLLALYSMGMLLASLFLAYGRSAWHATNLLQEPIFILSGFYFPVKFLGKYVAVAASLLPITLEERKKPKQKLKST